MKYALADYYDPIPEAPVELTPAQRTTLKTQLKAFIGNGPTRSWDDIAHAARGRYPKLPLGVVRELLDELIAAEEVKAGNSFPDPSTIPEPEPE